MKIQEIVTEAPVGALRQAGRRLGAKAAGAVGMKGTAAGLTGAADTGKQARQLAVDLKGYAGRTGLNVKQLDAQDLSAFLQSKNLPTTPLSGVTGILTPKQIDQALLKSAQEQAKAGGATAGSGVRSQQQGQQQGQQQKSGSFLDRAAQAVGGKAPKKQQPAQQQGQQQGQQPAQQQGQQQGQQPAQQQPRTFTPGDTVTYTNKKGEDKQGEVIQVLPKKDKQGNNLIQLGADGAKFAMPQSAIKSATGTSKSSSGDVKEKIKNLSQDQIQELLRML